MEFQILSLARHTSGWIGMVVNDELPNDQIMLYGIDHEAVRSGQPRNQWLDTADPRVYPAHGLTAVGEAELQKAAQE